ncbi:acyltransferase [Solihabitans fulvus]|uniref:Acyltransferase n=1 Tax=Solihabitans fulvus TaxID=1892852 RepID=A0A5B2WZP1_9PSEU|nr:acyltransferase [Solihabitans fulvus]
MARQGRYRLGFRPDIEGLRAVAVLTVLGFHAAVPFCTGGYVGVDLFFVISGFLISGLLLGSVADRGVIRLKDFYARRARRILPAAGVVLVVTAIGGLLLLPPLRQRDLAYDTIAAALNLGNWRFVANQTDYLAANTDPSPLLHYWSLGVEEQFYLLWAPLLLGLVLLARRLRRSPFPLVVGAVAAITLGSFALSVYWTGESRPLAYLGSPSRAWQFGVGAAVALVAPAAAGRFARPAGLVVRRVLGWAGAAAIAWSTVTFGPGTPFPGTAALLPTLGAAAVILAGTAGDTSPDAAGIGRFLGLAPIRAIGRLSFAWYLWHWPVLILAEARLGPLPWPAKLALVLASALPAWLTMRLVERPLRFSAAVAARPSRGLATGVTAMMLPVAAGLLLGSGAAHSMGTDSPTTVGQALVGAAEGPTLLAGPGGGATGGPVFPGPATAREDFPQLADCQVPPPAISSPKCLFGDTTSAHRIVLLGDSHAAQWFPAVAEVAKRRGWALEVLTKSGCPLPRITVQSPQLGREYRECDTWRDAALDRVAAGPRPELIVMSALNRYTADRAALARGWDYSLGRLGATGAPVVYLRDTPFAAKDIPTCLSGELANWSACAFPRTDGMLADPLAEDVVWGRRPALRMVDVTDVLCPPGDRCPAVLDGVLLYRDDAHLTNTAAALLSQRVARSLEVQGLVPVLP